MNPQAAEKKVAEANQKYFSNMAEFLKVKKESKMWSNTHTHTQSVIMHMDSYTDTGAVDYFEICLIMSGHSFCFYFCFSFLPF